MSLRPYKFVVTAVMQQTDGDRVTGEVAAEPVQLYGCEELALWASLFESKLVELQAPVEAET